MENNPPHPSEEDDVKTVSGTKVVIALAICMILFAAGFYLIFIDVL